MPRFTHVLTTCLAVLAALPAAAGAAEVQQGAGGTDGVVVVGVTSDPRNDLTLTQVGAEVVIEDAATPLTYYGGACRQESANRVVCPMPRATRLNISTSDRDDSVTMRLAADAPQADIYTNGGNDTVVGGPSVEMITTGEGNDSITAGGARDKVYAEGGDDLIDSADAPAGSDPQKHEFPDEVECGAGTDTWRADLDDLPSRTENQCERIDSPDRTTDFVTGGDLGFRKRTVDVRATAFQVKLRCTPVERCVQSLQLSDAKGLVAKGEVSIRAGAAGTATLKLTSYGKRTLKKKRSLKVAARTVAGNVNRARGSLRLRWRTK
jgi:Ca2+-binding RTX toxin-like protein